MRNLLFSLIFLVSSGLLLAPALAQEPSEPTQAQRELNDQGIEAIVAEEYMRAVRLFEASLDLGELNITFVNMARAYQRAGMCEEADQYYGRALEAPPVISPTPEQIAEVIETYRQEMRETCPGFLEPICDPAELSLFINDEGPEDCAQGRFKLPPGEYTVRGEYEGESTEAEVEIEALRTTQLQIGLEITDVGAPEGEGIAPLDPPPAAASPMEPWMWFAASGVAIVGGLAIDTLPATARNQELDAMDFVPLAFYGAGIGLAVYGITQIMD